MVRSAADASRPMLNAAGTHSRSICRTQPVTVTGDAVRLTQVFCNLLNNAAKYTTAGGHIVVRLSKGDGRAAVSVRDDGIGIAAGASSTRCSTCSRRSIARTASHRAGSASA